MAGVLYLVSLPIGNPEDLTIRAIRVLNEVAAAAAEDPQTSRRLFEHYGIETPLTSYQDRNKEEKAPILVQRLRDGQSLALICDSGTPLICDPGAFLVAQALSAGIRVMPVPGASAVTAALPASGLCLDSFAFLGSVPPTPRARDRFLAAAARESRTVVVFEAPDRVRATLRVLGRALGRRRIALAKDLTLPSEAWLRGTTHEVLARLPPGPVGTAVTLVLEGSRRPARRAGGTGGKGIKRQGASGSPRGRNGPGAPG